MSILKKLFPPNKKVSVHETYQPSAGEVKKAKKWIEKGRLKLINRMVVGAYEKYSSSKALGSSMRFYQHDLTNCIVISAGKEIKQSDMLFLFMSYTKAVKQLGYRIVNQDRRYVEQAASVQTILKSYLKPPLSFDVPIDQIYGNVLIELYGKDNQYEYLKLTITPYSDRNYQPALQFDTFLSEVMKADGDLGNRP